MNKTVEANPRLAINGKLAVRCPFHKEKSPSCMVDLHLWNFICFGCGAMGKATCKDKHLYDAGGQSTITIEMHPDANPTPPTTAPQLPLAPSR